MPRPMRIPMLVPTRTGCIRWLCDMHDKDLLFNLDDSPADILDLHTNMPVFSTEEIAVLNTLIPMLFNILKDPLSIIVELSWR